MLKKIIFSVILCCLLVNFERVYAKPKRVGPPYPEVWGYDLSTFPSLRSGFSEMKAYHREDGDILFIVTYSYRTEDSLGPVDKNVDFKYKLIPFFKGKEKIISEKEYKSLLKKLANQEIPLDFVNGSEISFSDGSKLKLCKQENKCNHIVPDYYDNFLKKIDKDGYSQNYSILGASVKVEVSRDESCAEDYTVPLLYKKLYHFKKMIPLKDDTFIMVDKNQNLILRFNDNLYTKFKPVTSVDIQGDYIWGNFFKIDYSLINKFEKEFLEEFAFYHPDKTPPAYQKYQNIHDRLLCYLSEDYD